MSGASPRSAAVRSVLLRVDRSAALGLAVLAVGAVLVALWAGWHGRSHEVVFSGDGSAVNVGAATLPAAGAAVVSSPDRTALAGSVSTASASQIVVVDVAGRVRRPGLVRVPAGSRVWDAVVAAGGFTHRADAELVNLARVLKDG